MDREARGRAAGASQPTRVAAIAPSWRGGAVRLAIGMVIAGKLAAIALGMWGSFGSARTAAAATGATGGSQTSPLAKAPPPAQANAQSAASGRTTGDATLAAADQGGGRRSRPVPASREARSLLEAIANRQSALDARERDLAARDERLQLYEKDVTEKLHQLEEIEKRLGARSKEAEQSADDAAMSLAKVYAAMKPDEAAPILEQLDEATVLRILLRMKEKQVGQILPLMARDKAIGLTRSLASGR